MSDDVRSLRDGLSKLFDGLCFLESGYQHQRGMASDETTRLLNAIMPLVKAHVQAAAVEMREECAKAAEPVDDVLAEVIRALPIPTDALDAMLLRARIEEVRQWLMSEGLDKAVGKGKTRDWRCKRMAEMERQLSALTQPALEKNEA